MKKNLKKIFSLRDSFSIIGLTGRKGAGVTLVSNVLSKSFEENQFYKPKSKELKNTDRKYEVLYDFAKRNWKTYKVINYKNVIFFHLLKYNFTEFSNFTKFHQYDFLINLKQLGLILNKYSTISIDIIGLGIINQAISDRNKLKKLSKIFFSDEFNSFVYEIDGYLKNNFPKDRIKFLQDVSNNLRKSGNPYEDELNSESHIFTIAELINRIIKGYKISHKETHIVINSLRNSLEIMFFKERYSAFYMFAVNSDRRKELLLDKNGNNEQLVNEIFEMDQEEYLGKYKDKQIRFGDFYIQDVQNCIQISDVFISNNQPLSQMSTKTQKFSKFKEESEQNVRIQLLRYTSLIIHPGLVTPSHQERCMQFAVIAKNNSGCISRKVGAVVTDEYFSIKAVGWNDVPKGTVPCNLRSVDKLINGDDVLAYSPYEITKKKDESNFFSTVKNFYSEFDSSICDGLNHSYCFKDFQNIIEGEKNQIYTRSLHAEENAMLQISKYGGQPLKNGMLFTTASPCELCSKKARQLEIKDIYYIDPYPGIAHKHILSDGDSIPRLILFAGAVGRAYSKLYESIMSYKDELVLVTGKTPKKK